MYRTNRAGTYEFSIEPGDNLVSRAGKIIQKHDILRLIVYNEEKSK